MGRKKTKSEGERRAVYLGVRLTPDERKQLQHAATAKGLTASELVRGQLGAILGQTGQDRTPAMSAGYPMN
jgi:hypothetical protein